MTKLAATKLNNDPLSFWSFLAVLITHALDMDWTGILQFNIGGALTRNILEHFAMTYLDAVVQAETVRHNENAIELRRQRLK